LILVIEANVKFKKWKLECKVLSTAHMRTITIQYNTLIGKKYTVVTHAAVLLIVFQSLYEKNTDWFRDVQTHISSRQTEKNLFLLLNYEEEGLISCRLDNVDIFTVPRANILYLLCRDDERFNFW
jgi:hypothetical protein